MAAETDERGIVQTTGFLFEEAVTPDLKTVATLKALLVDTQSEFQKVQIIETVQFGVTLVLDYKTQSAAADEAIYSESLVHAALLQHPDPKRVFIGGGGELHTAREVLKHSSVEKVVMVDIDEVVVDVARQHMAQWTTLPDGRQVDDDERFELVIGDAHAYLQNCEETFDVIIMDIADPIEAGPGIALYTRECYEKVASLLTPGGVYVTQSGPGAQFNAASECFSSIHNTLKSVFGRVCPYVVDIPSFGSVWGFNLAFNEAEGVDGDVAGRDPAAVDAQVAARIAGELKFYDGITHRGMFAVCKPVRDACAAEERIITMENPVFMY